MERRITVMISRFAPFCLLTLSLSAAALPVWAAYPNTPAYPPATKRVVVRALVQKLAQTEVQYDTDALRYKPVNSEMVTTEAALRALRVRLKQLRPDGYRHEVAKAVRQALAARIASLEVEKAVGDSSKMQQRITGAQLLNLRRRLAQS